MCAHYCVGVTLQKRRGYESSPCGCALVREPGWRQITVQHNYMALGLRLNEYVPCASLFAVGGRYTSYHSTTHHDAWGTVRDKGRLTVIKHKGQCSLPAFLTNLIRLIGAENYFPPPFLICFSSVFTSCPRMSLKGSYYPQKEAFLININLFGLLGFRERSSSNNKILRYSRNSIFGRDIICGHENHTLFRKSWQKYFMALPLNL